MHCNACLNIEFAEDLKRNHMEPYETEFMIPVKFPSQIVKVFP